MCIQNSVLKGEFALVNDFISEFARKILAAILSVFLFLSPSLSLFSFPPCFSFIMFFFFLWIVIRPSIWPVVPLESLLMRWHAHLSICICFHFDMSEEVVSCSSTVVQFAILINL